MRDIWAIYEKWTQERKTVTLATVVSVSGSSLRPSGSKMLFNSANEIYGSVSGGCVEGAVFEEAAKVASDGVPRLVGYGVSNEAAWEVGLSCGGSIKIFVESMSSENWQTVLEGVSSCIHEKKPGALVTVVSGPGTGQKALLYSNGSYINYFINEEILQKVKSSIPGNWAVNDPITLSLQTTLGEVLVFVDFLLPPPRLVIVGAVHIAIPLVQLAKTLDYHTIVVDPRSAFSTRERFPDADELIQEWPEEALEKLNLDTSTCVVCLSHDEKIDLPALKVALYSPARYIGALGSKVTNEKRLESLREEGVSKDKLSLLRSPVGLKIGGKEPAEIALSIMAEIVASLHGKA